MISSKEIAKEINKRLRDTWSDYEWKNGKDVEIPSGWAGRMKFITEQYVNAGWIVTKRAEICSSSKKLFYLNFKNPQSFKDCPKELRSTGVL